MRSGFFKCIIPPIFIQVNVMETWRLPFKRSPCNMRRTNKMKTLFTVHCKFLHVFHFFHYFSNFVIK